MFDINPLFSIVTQVYNCLISLSKAIDFELFQSYSNVKINVINDGSTGNNKSRDILIKYGYKIKYFKKVNGGVSYRKIIFNDI